MLKVKVDTITVDRGRLVIGMTVEGPDKAWVRFAVAHVPLSALDYSLFQRLGEEWDREYDDFANQPTLPYSG